MLGGRTGPAVTALNCRCVWHAVGCWWSASDYVGRYRNYGLLWVWSLAPILTTDYRTRLRIHWSSRWRVIQIILLIALTIKAVRYVFSRPSLSLSSLRYTHQRASPGGKLFDSSFGMDYTTGLWVTAGVVCACLFGGFCCKYDRLCAGCIMFVALVLVPIVAFAELGGYSDVVGPSNHQPWFLDLYAAHEESLPHSVSYPCLFGSAFWSSLSCALWRSLSGDIKTHVALVLAGCLCQSSVPWDRLCWYCLWRKLKWRWTTETFSSSSRSSGSIRWQGFLQRFLRLSCLFLRMLVSLSSLTEDSIKRSYAKPRLIKSL